MIIPAPDPRQLAVSKSIESNCAKLGFSQFGEDAVIWALFHAKRDGFYVDVGCHHPFRYSNTALLAIFNGWTGVNVDPDKRAIDLFNLHRPKDVSVHAGVAAEAGQLTAYIFNDGAVNTLDPAMAERQKPQFGEPRTETVPVYPLHEIMGRYVPLGQAIDLLNVDAEGLDHQVLVSNDWTRYRPRLISVEVHGFNLGAPQDNVTFQLMRSVGYRLLSHHWVTSLYERL